MTGAKLCGNAAIKRFAIMLDGDFFNDYGHPLYPCRAELLQALWDSETVELMQDRLEAWCRIADQSTMLYLKKFAKSLRRHCVGICNYAKHKLTSARIEAGNISIGMIRKRARGIRDTEYFKLKIRQSSLPDKDSMFYVAA